MRVGDLVRVSWGGELNRKQELGEVLRVEPGYFGGSQMYTARWGPNVEHTIDRTPIRARVLVLHYNDGGTSWWDEKDIELLGDQDGM